MSNHYRFVLEYSILYSLLKKNCHGAECNRTGIKKSKKSDFFSTSNLLCFPIGKCIVTLFVILFHMILLHILLQHFNNFYHFNTYKCKHNYIHSVCVWVCVHARMCVCICKVSHRWVSQHFYLHLNMYARAALEDTAIRDLPSFCGSSAKWILWFTVHR